VDFQTIRVHTARSGPRFPDREKGHQDPGMKMLD
jgi:hypothetical protein